CNKHVTLHAIETITQSTQANRAQLDVLPAREFSLQHAAELAERLATAGWDQLGGSAPQAPDALAPYTELVDKLREGSYAPGADAFAPALGATGSLLDHLGDRASVIFEDTVELELAHDALAAQAEELLAEREVTATARDTVGDVPARGSLIVARVPLAEGFDVPELGLRVFTDAEVFGFRKPRHPERRRRRVHIGTFLSDLKPGDHVVHEDH